MFSFPIFSGNCPRRGSRDTKYSIRIGRDTARGFVIGLSTGVREDERWYPTTEPYPELVDMVNRAKRSLGLGYGGAFYINEHRQVIVPSRSGDAYYIAGNFYGALRFDVDGRILSGEPLDADREALVPGAPWTGPRLGFPYLLASGGNDVMCSNTTTVRGRATETKQRLSDYIGAKRGAAVAGTIRKVKGPAGGRFFVNEFRAAFAPIQKGCDWQFVYVCQIDLADWFPPANQGDAETHRQAVDLTQSETLRTARRSQDNRGDRDRRSATIDSGSFPRFELDKLLNE